MTDPTSPPAPPASLDDALTGLEQVIEAAMADPVHWRAFEALLPSVDLFVVPEGAFAASVGAGLPGTRTLRPDQAMDMRGVTLEDGVIAAAVFTDPRRLQAVWGTELPFVAMNARHLLHLFRDRPMMLNLGSPRAMLFQIEDVAALLAAAEAQLASQFSPGGRPSGTVQTGTPQQEPTVLVERLKTAFGAADGVTGISAAWLMRAHWAETNRWGWMVDVRTMRPMDEVRAIVSRAVTGVDFGAETLDVSLERRAAKRGRESGWSRSRTARPGPGAGRR